ncbi:MAG: FmdE family protein [Planctomycetia bacterium]|nr:FmdE family protein [Planctomycetia bacterium]
MTTLTPEQIQGTISFHGHHCPGLTIGLRAAEFCLREIGSAKDEDVVAIVENDMCAVDAVQFLTGCTFGKGNFIFRDYGKAAFSFFRRSDDKRVRVILNPNLCADLRTQMENLPRGSEEAKALRQQMIDRLMEADLEDVFLVSVPEEPLPAMARLHKTIACDRCGEGTMETRLTQVGTRRLCVECAKKSADE